MNIPAAETAVAKRIHDFWYSKHASELVRAGFIADGQRETSLNPHIGGDKVKGVPTAWDLAQHHQARRDFIRVHTGIDMVTASVEDQCAGIYFEITDSRSQYRHVWPALVSARTALVVNTILISKFEQSGNQPRDLAEQLPMAAYWLEYARQHWRAEPSSEATS